MDEIKGIARAKIRPGKLDECKRLSAEAMEIVRTKDRGTLQYEIFFNEDESEAVVFERYRDADAAIEHFANISHLMEPLMATATVTGEVLGTPNAKMQEQLGKGGAEALHAVDGVAGSGIAPAIDALSGAEMMHPELAASCQLSGLRRDVVTLRAG